METLRLRNIPVLKQLTILLIVLILLLGKGIIDRQQTNGESNSYETNQYSHRVELLEEFELPQSSLEAETAIVWDISSQRVLFSKSPDNVMPLASITKLMTLLLTYELGEYTERVAGFKLEELADLTITSSSNQGASELANAIGSKLTETNASKPAFVAAMNLRAKELGLFNMKFHNPTGLDESETLSGGYGSAREVAFLMEYILETDPSILGKSKLTSYKVTNDEGLIYEVTNTNQYVNEITGLIGSKTGYTTLAGGNLVVAIDVGMNHPVVIVVLGSSPEGRFLDTIRLVSEITNQYDVNM
tara:strand:- start:577 stop:1485 length:909 start_codon:yes stop_codon:yes gene_type:complete